MTWIIYALVAYAFVSVANIIDKFLVEKQIKDSSTIVLFTGTVAFVTGVLLYIIRGFPILPPDQLVCVIAAGVLLEIYLLPYFRALELEDASSVVPLFQAIPVFTLLFSFVFLKEVLLPKQYIGFVFLLGSGVMLSLAPRSRGIGLRRAFWLMMLSSMLCAVAHVFFKFVVDLSNVWDAIAYESMGIGLGTLMIFAWPGYMRRFIHHAKRMKPVAWGALATSEVFYILFRVLYAFALSLGSVSLISVLGGSQPVFVLVYAWILSVFAPSIVKEAYDKKILTKKFGALVGIFIGLWLIYQ